MGRANNPINATEGSLPEALKEGPVSSTRRLLKTARAHQVVSMVYHYTHKFSPLKSTFPYLHFETGNITARSDVPIEHADILEKCHQFIIDLGKPIVLSNFLPAFAEAQPRLTEEIWSEANRMGVYDQYMVPVFGPFDVNGVIAFGFAEIIAPDSGAMLQELEAAAAAHHNRVVRHFGKHSEDVELSRRENDVLTWIVRGKSNADISTILGISRASVDTYTRRIFEKMGVNSRISAAVSGVTKGLVKPGYDDLQI